MISEEWILRLGLTTGFSGVFLVYVTYLRTLFFRKDLTYDTTRRLVVIQRLTVVIVGVIVFLFLTSVTLFLLGF